MHRFALYCLLTLLLISCNPHYDVIITGGMIVDGTGAAPYAADLSIRDGQIVAIDEQIDGDADRIIDASGKYISPGFIDVHAHLEPLSLYTDGKSHVMQGVTTAIGGPDGGSPLPLGEYLDSLSSSGIGLNVGYMIGHNTVRNHVMGLIDQAPSDDDMKAMKQQIEQGMKDGAFGISTGLKYLPGAFSATEEIIELSKVAAAAGGIYTSHLRDEGLGILESVSEAIRIAREAAIPVVLTHHKVIGEPMWGASTQTLEMVDAARKEGLDIRMDQYPYTASHTSLSVVIPAWALEGNPFTNFAARCEDPVLRDSIKAGIIYNLINDRGGNDLRRIQFSRIDWKPDYAGKTLHDLVMDEGLETTIENGAEMIIRIQLHRGANCIYHVIDPEDVQRIMLHPYTMIASDGRLTQFGEGHPHPRAYGTFPRVLGHYSRELETISMETAVRKMTGLPAETMGIPDRGLIRAGNYADITIFNPESVKDKATFQEPHAYPVGIDYVLINGKIAVDEGVYQGLLPGMVLKKNQYRSNTN